MPRLLVLWSRPVIVFLGADDVLLDELFAKRWEVWRMWPSSQVVPAVALTCCPRRPYLRGKNPRERKPLANPNTSRRDRLSYRDQARVLKALANEARLMIIDRLMEGECTAGGLTEIVGLDASTVSKHLAVLRAHGIVEDRREGSSVHYRLLTPCVASFFSCTSEVLAASRLSPEERERPPSLPTCTCGEGRPVEK